MPGKNKDPNHCTTNQTETMNKPKLSGSRPWPDLTIWTEVGLSPQVFVMPCPTSLLLKNLQYLDLSENLFTDMTLSETLCYGVPTLKDLHVLNFSANALKVTS